jgi:hypothetical protein
MGCGQRDIGVVVPVLAAAVNTAADTRGNTLVRPFMEAAGRDNWSHHD